LTGRKTFAVALVNRVPLGIDDTDVVGRVVGSEDEVQIVAPAVKAQAWIVRR
jgi:hypothetical protein